MKLSPNCTPGAQVTRVDENTWHLEIPAGQRRRYRLAQLDDYTTLQRRDFPWQPPFSFELRARLSAANLPGTWGFGLWNDPFSLSLGLGGGRRRFPALPNAAWFFYASPPNYLSFRDDLPAQGFLAATFRAPQVPVPLLTLTAPLLPAGIIPLTASWLRSLLRRLVKQDAVLVTPDITAWHHYALEWFSDRVCFRVDGKVVLETQVVPLGRLGLVIWIDNQYAAFPPGGRLGFGTLHSPLPAWMEVADSECTVLDNTAANR